MAVLDHEGLVIKIANRYNYFAERYSNVDKQDIIQEAWVAVIKKHDSYYTDKPNCAISTYLTNWIQDGIRQYIKKRSVFRRSLNNKAGESLNSYIRTQNTENEQVDGEEPTSSSESLINLCASASPEEELIALESVEEVLRVYTEPIDNNGRARRTKKYIEFKDILGEEPPERKRSKNGVNKEYYITKSKTTSCYTVFIALGIGQRTYAGRHRNKAEAHKIGRAAVKEYKRRRPKK